MSHCNHASPCRLHACWLPSLSISPLDAAHFVPEFILKWKRKTGLDDTWGKINICVTQKMQLFHYEKQQHLHPLLLGWKLNFNLPANNTKVPQILAFQPYGQSRSFIAMAWIICNWTIMSSAKCSRHLSLCSCQGVGMQHRVKVINFNHSCS